MGIFRVFAALALISFVGVNCSSSTFIRTNDPEAKLYVDGEYRGKGEAQWSDSKTVISSTNLRMEKPGCRTVQYTFSKTEFDAGACAGGVFLLVPFLWILKYKPEHYFPFDCDKVSTAK